MLLPGLGMRACSATCSRARRAEFEHLRGRGSRERLRRHRDDGEIRHAVLQTLCQRNHREQKTMQGTIGERALLTKDCPCSPLDRLIDLLRKLLAAANLRGQDFPK